uniref:Ac81 n=2 Tax=Helicoverpa armigera nucleopolyhedrovirus TaxID=51313 RepID=A0A482ERV1_9ABAC|nr:ac81 [Helicoverpa armigera nucleopolyhedrovirus]
MLPTSARAKFIQTMMTTTMIPTSTTPLTDTTTLDRQTLHRPFKNLQLSDKNLTTLNRIKYDSELLIHYLFDNLNNSENLNIIKVCKVRVKKAGGTLLAHYYAKIQISNGYTFEFHPGSQPKTFQTDHSDGHLIGIRILCDECCKRELRSFVEGENVFNLAFHNCEAILCKRRSMQTVLITMTIVVLIFNMIEFSWFYIFFIIFILILLYVNNNYMISNPTINYCPHKLINYNVAASRRHYSVTASAASKTAAGI